MPSIYSNLYQKTPEEVQELLNSCVSKTSLIKELNISLKTLNKYIKKYNLTHQKKSSKSCKPRAKPLKIFREPNSNFIPTDLKQPSREEALKIFYKILAEKREKRLRQELKDAYYWY